MFEHFALLSPFALLLLPLFVLLDLRSRKQMSRYYMPHVKFYHLSLQRPNALRKVLKWVLIVSVIVALAMPVCNIQKPMVKKDAIDIVLALDISGSMSLYGFNPKVYEQTRLDAVKEVVGSFMLQRKNDRVGLVVFGTHAAIASPLSFERETQKRIVKGLSIGAMGKSTALIDAVVSSVRLLKESQSKSKVIILLSDGEDSSSKVPLVIAKHLLKKYHIKIYTVIIDKTHSNMMAELSKTSATKPYVATTKSDLEKVYKQIDILEKSPVHYHTLTMPVHLYAYFLILALLSGLALLVLNKEEIW